MRQGAAPWTILPATQFHQLLSAALHRMRWSSGLILPRGVSFQSIDASDVARRIVELIESGPAGDADPVGGPEVIQADEMARGWLQATGLRRPVIGVPLIGKVACGYRAGHHLAPDHPVGTITWVEHLATSA